MMTTASTTTSAATTTPSPEKPLIFTPYTVAIDTREQLSYVFAEPIETGRPRRLHVVQTARSTLQSGDYSLVGFESSIAIERKSLSDLFNTLGQGRGRFHRELARLASYEFAAIVVEAEWSRIATAPPPRSKLSPRVIAGTVVSWQQTYRNVHWWFVPGRDAGEAVTVRMLDRFWRNRERV